MSKATLTRRQELEILNGACIDPEYRDDYCATPYEKAKYVWRVTNPSNFIATSWGKGYMLR